jgi:hypothetical protein
MISVHIKIQPCATGVDVKKRMCIALVGIWCVRVDHRRSARVLGVGESEGVAPGMKGRVVVDVR